MHNILLFAYKQQLLSTLKAPMRGHNKCCILRNNEEKYVYHKCCVENLVDDFHCFDAVGWAAGRASGL